MQAQFTTNRMGAKNAAASKKPLTGESYTARRAQVAAILAAILTEGQPETHDDSNALFTHFKLRRGLVGGEQAEVQVYRHVAGIALRFWVYGLDFSVKVRDLVLLPSDDKGMEVWLDADDRLFPHEGKYAFAARQIAANLMAGH